MALYGNMIGGIPSLKTLKLVDSNGAELIGVVVDQETVFTADASSDIRQGKVAATDAGVVTGSAIIPNYYMSTGYRLIEDGSAFVLPIDDYDYTKLQAIICSFNTSMIDSVSAEQIVVEDQVFSVQSTEAISSISKDMQDSLINFGVTNTSGKSYLIRYFMYRELY